MLKLVAVTGCHEAPTRSVVDYVESLGYPLTFPEQDLDVQIYEAHGPTLLRDWRQNIEVLRLHEATLRDNGLSWHHPNGPVRTAVSPLPFIEQFADKLLIHDPRLCLLIGLWKPFQPKIIFVESSAEQTSDMLYQLFGGNREYWVWLHGYYRQKIDKTLSSALVLPHPLNGPWQIAVRDYLGESSHGIADRPANPQV